MKKVLIGFEESQAVTKAFRKRGFEAYSNDIKECTGGHPEWHLQMDIFDALKYKEWDLIILHPPCTAVAISGNSTYAKGKPKEQVRLDAIEFIQKVWDRAKSICQYVALENPVGCLNTLGNFPKPQYIQPYQFGHTDSKKTGLWLHNLPKLTPTKIMEPVWHTNPDGSIYKDKSGSKYSPTHFHGGRNLKARWSNQTPSGQNKLGPSPDRGTLRSKTYEGIAEAFATQWGDYINQLK